MDTGIQQDSVSAIMGITCRTVCAFLRELALETEYGMVRVVSALHLKSKIPSPEAAPTVTLLEE